MLRAFLVLFTFSAFAQDDLSSVQKLDKALPDFTDYTVNDDQPEVTRQSRRYKPPKREVSMQEIQKSGTSLGAVNRGAYIRNLETNKDARVTELMYVKFYNLEDEYGFKYLLDKNGQIQWKIQNQFLEPIKEELVLYEPPPRYTPAPETIIRADYDKKLSIPPELSFYAGIVQGDFMRDLFNDEDASNGISNQYGIHFFTQWKLPIKAGAVIHYERSSYKFRNGGQIIYSSPSIGPQFKTRDFEVLGQPLRFQAQFRVSPFSRASLKTDAGEVSFKFNSADLLASIERPIKNRFGEFVLGLYVQNQWLNLKDQSEAVDVKASNETNKSFGISLSQVFE